MMIKTTINDDNQTLMIRWWLSDFPSPCWQQEVWRLWGRETDCGAVFRSGLYGEVGDTSTRWDATRRSRGGDAAPAGWLDRMLVLCVAAGCELVSSAVSEPPPPADGDASTHGGTQHSGCSRMLAVILCVSVCVGLLDIRTSLDIILKWQEWRNI